MASDLVREGNEAFVDDDYELAVKKYSEAIEQNAYDPEFYLKRASAFMKLSNYQAAVTDTSSAASLQPTNCKAHTRKGVALFHLEDFKAAKQTFSDALQLDKENKELKMWIRKCDAELDLSANEAKVGAESAEKAVFGTASEADPQPSQTEKSAKPDTQGAVNGGPVSPSDSVSVADSSASASSVTETQSRQEQPQAKAGPPKPRFDWYQTETHVIVTIMIKNTKQENVSVEYGEKTLGATVKLPTGSEFSLELDLAHAIVPVECKTRIMSTKIELKIKKAEGIRWSCLEGDDEIKAKQFPTKEKPSDTSSVHKYPSSRHVSKDWDKVAAQIAKDEKEEKHEGEAALNQLFQQIYGDGNEEVRKAMNKSFVESGGTVLSTNWGEVKQGHVDCKPPDGMEFKKWDH